MIREFSRAFDAIVDDVMRWINSNASAPFDFARFLLDAIFDLLDAGLAMPPFWAFIAAVAVIGWRLVGLGFALFVFIGLLLCQAMGLWDETMKTLALVLSASIAALAIAIPAGILVGLNPGTTKIADAVLDFIQTMPPYIYLLPGIALLGYGPATAMAATIIVAIPPALRLTALGIRLTPKHLRELGEASGMTPLHILWAIRIPCALPSILAGINQSLMLGFGMVVIAGIAGSGGLGQAVYEAVRTLQIGRSVDAGVAIVILSIILDRISQSIAASRVEAG